MAESERRQRVISSTPRLTPEDIASRTFGSSFRGYAEAEVRSFLRRVSEELTATREREQQLVDTLDDLEEQLRSPKPLDERQLLDALGEETARLLRSAREAADDIKRKAEERSSSVMEEAQSEAHRLRTEASEILAVRTQEAESAAAEIVGEAEARSGEVRASNDRLAEEQRARSEQEAEAIVEGARQQGREMLDEARNARERVLSDLARRRGLLQAQVEELRQGRDRLLEAYRIVKRTFLDATEALAQVEARAATGRSPSTPHAGPAPAAGDGTHQDGEHVVASNDAVEVDIVLEEGVEAMAEASASSSTAPDLADVDSLFARIRAGQSQVEVDATIEDATAGDAEPGREEIRIDEDAPGPEAKGDERPEPSAGTAAEAWRSRHRAAVDPLVAPLVKRAKRAAQDDQNALLDAVRRHKGRPSAEQVLRGDDALAAAWTDVLKTALDGAYAAGREAAGAEATTATDEVLRAAAETVAFPLRDRVAIAIDDVDAGDTSGLVERIGARYREWKNQQLERVLGDVMVMAWSRGVYDGSADGTVLQWIPEDVGRCADCDDNALEPTVKGATFPTGQACPPAHPGCRCILAPAAVLAGLTP